jgi:hypothetical protein
MQGEDERTTNPKPEHQTKPEHPKPNEPKLPEPDLDKIIPITKGAVNPEEKRQEDSKK